MTSDNKLSITLFWTKVNQGGDNSFRQNKSKICKIVRKFGKSEYTNAVDHLNEKHKKCKDVFEKATESINRFS